MRNKTVLIIDDSKAVIEILQLKFNKVHIDSEVASSFEEARKKLFNREENGKEPYFIALVDLNLPDSSNYEALEYVLDKNIPAIVLSANASPDLKERSLDIIDYINKSEPISFDYAAFMVKRLMQTHGTSAIVLNDSSFQGKIIRQYLEVLQFKVYNTETADETIQIIEEKKPRILITDYIIKNGNSYSMIARLRKKYSIDELIIIALTGSTQKDLSVELLKVGANDFLQKPFKKEEFNKRVLKEIEIQSIIQHQKRNLNRLYDRVPLIIIRSNGTIIKASHAFFKIFDIEEKDVLGLNISDISPLTKEKLNLSMKPELNEFDEPSLSLKNISLRLKNHLPMNVDMDIYDNTKYGMEWMAILYPRENN